MNDSNIKNKLMNRDLHLKNNILSNDEIDEFIEQNKDCYENDFQLEFQDETCNKIYLYMKNNIDNISILNLNDEYDDFEIIPNVQYAKNILYTRLRYELELNNIDGLCKFKHGNDEN